MSAIVQSVAWWCFVPDLLSPERFVAAAAEAGFWGLDLVPPEHWEPVRDRGLAISSIAGHQPLEVGLDRCDQHERIEREIRAAIGHARRLGIPNVICFSGNREGLDDATGLEVTAEGLRALHPWPKRPR